MTTSAPSALVGMFEGKEEQLECVFKYLAHNFFPTITVSSSVVVNISRFVRVWRQSVARATSTPTCGSPIELMSGSFCLPVASSALK